MAIAFDAVSSRQATDGSGNTLTYSHTITGNNPIIWAGFNSDADTITGITYNGVSMTLVDKVLTPSGGRESYLFYLLSPATGSNNVIVTSSVNSTIIGYTISYTGVRQSGQPDASTTNTGTGVNTLPTSLTTVADGCWTIVSGRSAGAATTFVAGAGTTYRANGSNGDQLADSNGPITPAGSTSLTINWTNNGDMGLIMASFAPATGGNFLQFM